MTKNDKAKENVPPQGACDYLKAAMMKVVEDIKENPPQDHAVIMSVKCTSDKLGGELTIETPPSRCQRKKDEAPKQEKKKNHEDASDDSAITQLDGPD